MINILLSQIQRMVQAPRIGIYFADKDYNKAKELFDVISLNSICTRRYCKNMSGSTIQFTNGSIIRFVSLNDNSRGNRFTNIIVLGDTEILNHYDETIRCIVIPTLTIGCNPTVINENGEIIYPIG